MLTHIHLVVLYSLLALLYYSPPECARPIWAGAWAVFAVLELFMFLFKFFGLK